VQAEPFESIVARKPFVSFAVEHDYELRGVAIEIHDDVIEGAWRRNFAQ
jgi:hypothetical protein